MDGELSVDLSVAYITPWGRLLDIGPAVIFWLTAQCLSAVRPPHRGDAGFFAHGRLDGLALCLFEGQSARREVLEVRCRRWKPMNIPGVCGMGGISAKCYRPRRAHVQHLYSIY